MLHFFNGQLGLAIIAAIVAITVALIGLVNPVIQQKMSDRSKRREQKEAEKKARAEDEEQRQFIERCLRRYREKLSEDKGITHIKILDMTTPVELQSIYVPQRLQLAASTSPSADIVRPRDPNVLLQVVRKRIEESYAAQGAEPLQVLRDKKQCLILGDPGSGKTTLLKYLTVQALAGTLKGMPDLLPIYIELSKFAESQKENLLDFIADDWDRTYGFNGHARTHLEPCLREGKILLLLDALDEAALGADHDERRAAYKRAFEAIEQLVRGYSPYIAVTARSAGYRLSEGSLSSFSEFEVSALRPQDVSTFVIKWFGLPGPNGAPDPSKVARGRELNNKLKNNLRLQTLAANPLLLSLMALLYERDEDLPERRADLYRRAVNLLLTEWDRTRGLDRYRYAALKIEQKERLLSDIAWHFHNKHMRYFRADELLALIAQFLQGKNLPANQSRAVLDEISADNGLLKPQADEWYGFLHLSFQEYFAARYAAREQQLDELTAHRGEPWWEEVILLYAGSADDIAPLLERLLGRDSAQLVDDIFSTNLVLAARCLVAYSTPEANAPALQQEVISKLFSLLQNTPSPLIRQRAAEMLAELGHIDDGVNARLIQLLSDNNTNENIARSIASALSTYGVRSLVPRLFALLSKPAIADTAKDHIAEALAGAGDVSTIVQSLSQLTDKHTDPRIRGWMIHILGRVEDRSHAPELLSILLDDHDEFTVRSITASAWKRAGDPAATLQLLVKLADSHIDEYSVFVITRALLTEDDPSIAPTLLKLIAAPQSKLSPAMQGYISVSLSVLASQATILERQITIQEFIQIIDDQHTPLLARRGLIQGLALIGDKAILPELRLLYVDPNTQQALKPDIARTLYLLGDDSVGIDARTMLAEAKVYRLVEQYLAEQLDTATLLQMLSDSHIATDVRAGIARTFANVKNSSSIVPKLCALAANRKLLLDVRKAIIETLGKIADDRASAETLAELLNQDRQVYDEAERALWLVCRRAGLRAMEDPLTRRVMIE